MRAGGYYWVKSYDAWHIAHWSNYRKCWDVAGSENERADSYWHAIDERRIERTPA